MLAELTPNAAMAKVVRGILASEEEDPNTTQAEEAAAQSSTNAMIFPADSSEPPEP